jgi:hypothetical protein
MRRSGGNWPTRHFCCNKRLSRRGDDAARAKHFNGLSDFFRSRTSLRRGDYWVALAAATMVSSYDLGWSPRARHSKVERVADRRSAGSRLAARQPMSGGAAGHGVGSLLSIRAHAAFRSGQLNTGSGSSGPPFAKWNCRCSMAASRRSLAMAMSFVPREATIRRRAFSHGASRTL